MQGALDTLKLAKTFKRRGTDLLPSTYTDFWAEKNSLLENLGLSWRQRIGCIFISVILSFFFFFRSLMSIISFPITPESFGWNFAMFSVFILSSLCFFSGFKTFFKNILSSDMVIYSGLYVISTILTVVCKRWSYIIRLPISISIIITFLLFVYTYSTKKFKSGIRGIGSSLSIF
ncbi:hypothetical protein NEPAR06_2304 [Nematocida parisii]|nr:hypothetical protein NEPAR03_2509 [Nematocida parisii]KAI5131710.1 hypothetical protein NEPAR08_2549 [Nematocida parisii]KAI5146333.1 hypothetical protein NEPAR07_2301 [Nematocida parisii]KAI5156822.1 hypothetical protein NEPAR06_2304 [Nematocida parisii]KAI5159037.1 hypothetical protein NEPAR05_2377 [Nematocida parisii]